MPSMRNLNLPILLFMLFVIYGCQTTSSTSKSTPPVSDLKADKAVSDEVKKVASNNLRQVYKSEGDMDAANTLSAMKKGEEGFTWYDWPNADNTDEKPEAA